MGSLVLETLPVSNSLFSEVAFVTSSVLVASDAEFFFGRRSTGII
jgi:hypothetical protein